MGPRGTTFQNVCSILSHFPNPVLHFPFAYIVLMFYTKNRIQLTYFGRKIIVTTFSFRLNSTSSKFFITDWAYFKNENKKFKHKFKDAQKEKQRQPLTDIQLSIILGCRNTFPTTVLTKLSHNKMLLNKHLNWVNGPYFVSPQHALYPRRAFRHLGKIFGGLFASFGPFFLTFKASGVQWIPRNFPLCVNGQRSRHNPISAGAA